MGEPSHRAAAPGRGQAGVSRGATPPRALRLAAPRQPATILGSCVGSAGGFHEDGLADVADAAGAHVARERKLEILRDSRVGTYGALAIAFPLVLLAPLDDRRFLEAARMRRRPSASPR